MKPAFRQVIRPGQSGRDVRAVKIAYRRIGVSGAGAIAPTRRAGPAFVHVTRTFQRHHGELPDGIYGERTHNALRSVERDGRPAFSAYAAMLYRTARKRGHPAHPPAPDGTAANLAQRLLGQHSKGAWRDDSGTTLYQVQRAAKGEPVWSQGGRWVHLDRQIFAALLWLIESGHAPLGTSAICSDHHFDGWLGHAGGHSVDISTFHGVSVASPSSRSATLAGAEALHTKRPAALAPWQLICGGYGNMPDSAIEACCVPSASFFIPWLPQHRNHVHLGYE